MITYTLIKTSSTAPEQYDVFDSKTQVGYLRLRSGVFRVDFIDGSQDEDGDFHHRTLSSHNPKGQSKLNEEELDHYLRLAVSQIHLARITRAKQFLRQSKFAADYKVIEE
ncbi:hypothetical protein OAE19_05155 [Porticoccaceae bacterium]|nr:hypothetical protein [Porticoccaceae bacterium]